MIHFSSGLCNRRSVRRTTEKRSLSHWSILAALDFDAVSIGLFSDNLTFADLVRPQELSCVAFRVIFVILLIELANIYQGLSY